MSGETKNLSASVNARLLNQARASGRDFQILLTEAIRGTFARRQTPIPVEEPIALTPAYWENPSRPPQVRAFARRAGLDPASLAPADVSSSLAPFLMPLLEDLRHGRTAAGSWPPGGPWR